ncbi:MAG: PilN domain-containing protein [Zoogloeaceae bacterium]|jgi:type IV pilus assembly protein PilN|nr:PilN domain-containing protein [Zoogloeaceae bacterium]
MIIRINLLPYREAAKQQRRQEFITSLVLVAILAVLIVVAGYMLLSAQVASQKGRNDFLNAKMAEIDKQIVEVKELQAQSQALLDRKNVIEQLQNGRNEAVYLFNEIVERTPSGVYLTELKREKGQETIELKGNAQTYSRVATFVKNLQAADQLDTPQLKKVETLPVNGRQLQTFTLTFQLKKLDLEKLQKQHAESKSSKPAGGKQS